MMNFVRRLFRGQKQTTYPGESAETSSFARRFIDSEVYVLWLAIPDSLDFEGLSQDAVLRLIEKAAREPSSDSPVSLFTFAKNDETFLPIFTDGVLLKNSLRTISPRLDG